AMAAHGLSGVEDVFCGERSFFVAYPGDPQALVRRIGETFEILNASIKRWSVGSPIQAPLDSLVELMKERFAVADVKSIVVRVAHQGANTVDNRDMPDICMQHMCAVMLLDGTVSFRSSHDEKRMRDQKVLAVRSRVDLHPDEELTRALPSRQGIVELKLKGG